MSRLSARTTNGHAYLVGVKPNEQEVNSPYRNTLQCIVDCFERLATLEDILYAEDGTEIVTLDRLREICAAERDGRCGEDDSPIITWQLYNLLAKSTRAEAEAALTQEGVKP